MKQEKEKIFDNCEGIIEKGLNNKKIEKFCENSKIDFVTFAFCQVVKDQTNGRQRKILTEVLEELRDDQKEEKHESGIIGYGSIEKTVETLGERRELGWKEIKVL